MSWRQQMKSAGIALAALATGCFGSAVKPGNTHDPKAAQGDHARMLDDSTVKQVSHARGRYKAYPGNITTVCSFAKSVELAFKQGTVSRGRLDGPALLMEVEAAIVEAIGQNPSKKADLLHCKGETYRGAGKIAKAVDVFREGMAVKPLPRTCIALIAELDKSGQTGEVVPLCKGALPNATGEIMRYNLLDACLKRSHAASVEEGLSWAGQEEIAFYHKTKQKRADSQSRHNAKLKADMDRTHQRWMQKSNCDGKCKTSYKRCKSFCPSRTAPCHKVCRKDLRDCEMACYRNH